MNHILFPHLICLECGKEFRSPSMNRKRGTCSLKCLRARKSRQARHYQALGHVNKNRVCARPGCTRRFERVGPRRYCCEECRALNAKKRAS